MTGTIINVLTILVGSGLGLLLGNRLSESTRQTVMGALGLSTLVLGAKMALTTQHMLLVMFSVLLGGVIGEWLRLDARMNALGDWLQRRLTRGGKTEARITEGFVTASVVFCVGPLAIIGSIQDGLVGNYELLAVKSLLDGFASMAFAAAMGWGVALSAASILVYQGGITVTAILLGRWLAGVSETSPGVIELGATGGVLIVAIGLLLLDVKRLRLVNYLPALAIAPALTAAVDAWSG